MKPDERLLLQSIARKPAGKHVRDLRPAGMHPKRFEYLLGKWCDRGWYDYGVSLDLGWLTAEGIAAASREEAAHGSD